MISKSIKCPFITQLNYCQKLDFEADPNNIFFQRKQCQNQLNFLLITRLKYCQKLDFEADPNNKLKPLVIKNKIKIN